ncbi:hypothetical protein [Sphaerisporangium flaviroseum]|uniref:hypothetical protein n=1 Tax=Sphaerisporangium flaviroseum TaxID=509199 RepID=UPI0031E764BD
MYNRSQSASNSWSWELGLACGNGWHGTNGGVYVKKDGQWKGGWVWSGAEYVIYNTIAGTRSSATEPAPPPPAWINADGTTDATKLPEKVDVVGTDGMPTGVTVNLKELVTAPALDSGNTPTDPAGVVRKYSTTTDENGQTHGVEDVTLTDAYRGRIDPRP